MTHHVLGHELTEKQRAELDRYLRYMLSRDGGDTAANPASVEAQLAAAKAGAGRAWAPPPGEEIYDTQRLVAQLRREKRRGSATWVLFVLLLAVGGVALAVRERPVDVGKQLEDIAANAPPEPGVPPTLERKETPVYVVKRGDSLSSIARDQLGGLSHTAALFEANRDQLETPSEIEVGMVLRLPRVDR